ncbi:MAG: indole-3-glycerol phosphate synthase TrpC [Bacteroidota bacterium]|nr:indole-3-glycerol phosphate synthase TrpC [Bacteroidota bacterium]
MNILEKIIAHKKKEVLERQSLYPTKLLEKSIYFETPTVSFKKYLNRRDLSGIIAEIKRKSPSNGIINNHISVEKLSVGYMQAGASALSVLTDAHFFGGKNEDLTVARKFNYCPILRKDFMVDEYQITEAKSIGADAILLIAAALTKEETKRLASFARSLDLEVLMEIKEEKELDHANEFVDVIGVNNRNLETFEVKIETSFELANKIPAEFPKVSESGIASAQAIHELKGAGFSGFLIGETFMKHARPEKPCADLIRQIKNYTKETVI